MGFPDALKMALQGRTIEQTSSGIRVFELNEGGDLVYTTRRDSKARFFSPTTRQMRAMDWEPVRGE